MDRLAEPLVAKLEDRSARVAVLGQGYVGLVVAMRASEAGFEVVGLEPDATRAAALADGRSYIEDVPDEVLQAALDRGYRPTADPADIAGYDVAVISVPTPLHEGLPDLTFIESAGRMAGEHLTAGALVVLESTTYPGTTQELLGPLLTEVAELTAGEDFLLAYSPERIDPGNPTFGLHNTPKVVGGIDQPSTDAVAAFFGAFVDQVVPVPGTGEAELTKILENTFRHVNIALVNELAMFAHQLGIDINASIDAAATKPFGFMPFRPGPGVGGHCLPVDPSYLSWRVKTQLGENFRFIELANDINEHMPHYVVRRITSLLNDDRKAVNGARILVLGVSYKPNVGDTRETPARPIVEQLTELGAELTIVDHYAAAVSDTFAGHSLHDRIEPEQLGTSDLVLLLVDHDTIDYAEVATTAARALDTRARLPRTRAVSWI
ncbi:MAG: nucleotide sugar dehydrogenase [Nitriliruptoraceae bacterium]|nr:nucleotide sugar dehydrogenase [Nitriliruptoraceae bacterium]